MSKVCAKKKEIKRKFSRHIEEAELKDLKTDIQQRKKKETNIMKNNNISSATSCQTVNLVEYVDNS